MKNILIIEDDKVSVDYFKIVLKEYNLFILYNTEKENVDQIFDNNHIDLALIDIRISPMDGLGLSKILKEKYPDLKIIIETAFFRVSKEDLKYSNDILIKPINHITLLDKVKSLIGS